MSDRMRERAKELEKCVGCGWSYPEDYVQPLVNMSGNSHIVCGICALEISNRLAHVERTEFTGPHAERLRQMAIRWREDHPAEKPDKVE